MPPKASSGKKILDAWNDLYYEYTFERFRPNYAMIASAEKVSDFYSLSETLEAMQYYFEGGGRNFYEFINRIDRFFKGSQLAKLTAEEFEELSSATTQQLRKILRERR